MTRIFSLMSLCLALSLCFLSAQQGPTRQGGETVARPNKDTAPSEAPPKIPSQYPKKTETDPTAPTFHSDVTTINLSVSVLDNKGRFIPNIPRGNFRVLEDNVPQQIKTFEIGEAPMTVCLVIEFSNLFQSVWSETWYQTLTASYGFLQTLKPEDYVAIVAYDLRPEMLSDFSTNKQQALEAMKRLSFPAYSEANLFDALTDTADRMSGIEGRKSIVLISSGIDTFSKQTLDKARKSLQNSGVPIYAIGLMQALRIMAETRMSPIATLDFLQADNQMKTFAKETGGQAYFPRFYGEFPSIFRSIAEALRGQYALTYQPANPVRDGKFHRIKVELVNPATNEPLRIQDEKQKPIKYTVLAKDGYTAPRAVE
jgi:Ca-activated chloride channel homolog